MLVFDVYVYSMYYACVLVFVSYVCVLVCIVYVQCVCYACALFL